MAAQTPQKIAVIIVMGVSGSGKTTTGKALAASLGWQFEDGDDFHSAANKAKMHAGHPLADADRMPWLQTLAEHIATWATSKPTVLACSALKESYRAILVGERSDVAVVYLKADFETIAARLNARTGHFMNKELLRSQFETLETPHGVTAEGRSAVIEVDADLSPAEIVEKIRATFLRI
ncbi:MAG: gluconokinase [Cyanobacteria bacterium REEB67]|nr:gluconokinase [Cyanobacteria bacterium REEB67]